MRTNFRQALLTSTIMIGALGIATPAFAQDSASISSVEGSDQPADEQIVVTGSRIARPDLTSVSPTAVVSAEEFELTGAVNVEQVLNTLPQVLPGTTGFSNNPGNGASTLNLRNLGTTRTLVLVNGRRWMFYDTNQIVDLNTIPQFMLANVDVVTGGASAVYGSDAVAGVVNFNLRTDLNGIEAGANYAVTERGDAARYTFDVALGADFADGRGNVAVYANYTQRDPVFQSARNFSNTAIADGCVVPGSADSSRSDLGTALPSGSSVVGCLGRGGELGFVNGGSANTPIATISVGTSTYIFNNTGGGTRLFQNPGDLYNFNPANYLQLPQERYLFGGFGSYEITPGVEAYTELSFVNSTVNVELAATPTGVSAPLQVASPFFNAQTRALLAPLDTDGDGYVTSTVNYRFLSAGARNGEQGRQAFRVLGGLRGDITENIRYDAYYLYSRTTNTQYQQGNVSSSRYLAALTTEFVPGSTTEVRCRDAAARAAGCVPINPFGLNLASAAAVNRIRINSTNLDISELKNAVASVSGSLFNLGWGADDAGFALGAEYREMSSRYIPDTFLSSGDVLGFNAGQPTSGSYNVKELFGELRIPILQDSFLYSVELNGAARYSDYSLDAVGGSWTYTAGAEIAPIEDIRFRGQYSRAVRAPNVADLFGGNSTGFPAATDPCSDRGAAATRTDALRALCIANGVPAASVFTRAVQPNTQIQADFGGNPNVGEETSDTYTVGAVFSPSFVPRFNLTVDYFNIKVDETIGVLAGGLDSALSLCFNTIQDLNNPICQVFVGRRGTAGALGASTGGQNPQFLSANVGEFLTSGIDIGADYNMQLFDGRLSFSYLGTWLDEFRTIPIASIPERENILEGTFGLPKYRHSSRLTYNKGPAQVSLRWRFDGKTKNTRIDNVFNGTTRVGTDVATITVPYLKARSYFDLTASFDASDALTLNIGVNNLLDKQAPIIGTGAEQANTLPSFYDVLGRDFFVSARLRF